MSIGMINRIHCKRGAMVCAMALTCAVLVCQFSANSLLALGVPEGIRNYLLSSPHDTTWRKGMSKSLYYLAGSNENGCRIVPYWEDNGINDTVLGASYTESSSSYLGSVEIQLEPDSAIWLSSRSIIGSGAPLIAGPYGATPASINLRKLRTQVTNNPGDCVTTSIPSYSCHNHPSGWSAIYCPSSHDFVVYGNGGPEPGL